LVHVWKQVTELGKKQEVLSKKSQFSHVTCHIPNFDVWKTPRGHYHSPSSPGAGKGWGAFGVWSWIAGLRWT
jgi:hypothetical protein